MSLAGSLAPEGGRDMTIEDELRATIETLKAKGELADEMAETLENWEDDDSHLAWLKFWLARYDALTSAPNQEKQT